MDVITVLERDIELLKEWFINLKPVQQQFIAVRVIPTLPFLNKNYPGIKVQDFLDLFTARKEALNQNNPAYERDITFFAILQSCINRTVKMYPKNEDEFLDWYNSVKSGYMVAVRNFMVNKLGKFNEDEAMMEHMEAMLHAGRTWTETMQKFTTVDAN